MLSTMAVLGATAGVVGAASPASAATRRDDGGSAGGDGKHRRRQFTLTSLDVDLSASGDAAADLIDAGGNPAGIFSSAHLEGGFSTLAFHVFDLLDGSLYGTGTGPVDGGTFAVTGGTMRYKNARGSYVTALSPIVSGGDGSGSFVFDLTLPEEG
jgi:hypothetical protein